MDPDELEPLRYRRVIIPRVLNYGTLADWRWLEQRYGREAVRAEAASIGRNSVREPSRRLAALLFA
jgi:hypothetical protein